MLHPVKMFIEAVLAEENAKDKALSALEREFLPPTKQSSSDSPGPGVCVKCKQPTTHCACDEIPWAQEFDAQGEEGSLFV